MIQNGVFFQAIVSSATTAENDVKPVTRPQLSCPDLHTPHHMTVAKPTHRKSETVNPVSTMDHLVNDNFATGPKGAQRNPIFLTSSRKLKLLPKIIFYWYFTLIATFKLKIFYEVKGKESYSC